MCIGEDADFLVPSKDKTKLNSQIKISGRASTEGSSEITIRTIKLNARKDYSDYLEIQMLRIHYSFVSWAESVDAKLMDLIPWR